MTKQIEGLVASLADELMTVSPEVPMAVRHGLVSGILKAQLSRYFATRSGVVDEGGIMEIVVAEWQRTRNVQSDEELHAVNRWKDGTRSLPAVPATVVLSAMRRVSKTDEGRNAVSDESDSGRNKFIAGKLRKHVEFVKFCDVDNSPFHASNLIDDLFEAAAALEAANLCGRNAVIDGNE